jgi:hypothetical protein
MTQGRHFLTASLVIFCPCAVATAGRVGWTVEISILHAAFSIRKPEAKIRQRTLLTSDY